MGVFAYLVGFFAPFAAGFAFFLVRSGAKASNGRPAKPRGQALPLWDCARCGAADCEEHAGARHGSGTPRESCRFVDSDGSVDRSKTDKVAVIRCSGTDDTANDRFAYAGRASCRVAIAHYGGPRSCEAACLGFGDCAAICPHNAIEVRNGLAAVVPERCTACGLCVDVCPKRLVELAPYGLPFVACRSDAPPARKRADCGSGCDACRVCEHHSMHGEFSLRGNLAVANLPTSSEWRAIASKCPRSVIRSSSESFRARRPADVEGPAPK